MFRFFTPPESVSDGQIILSGDNAAHIIKVLKMSAGEKIVVCDMNKTDYISEITAVLKNEVVVKILSKYKNEAENNYKINLYQGYPKSDKLETIIQKSTEMGVNRIIPVVTEFSVAKPDKLSDSKRERYNKICEAAAKQSGRGIIPEVSDVISFNESLPKLNGLTLVAYEKETENTLKNALLSNSHNEVNIFIGPEGGLSAKEIEQLKKAGAITVSLGNRILRTETAGLYILANINYEWGKR